MNRDRSFQRDFMITGASSGLGRAFVRELAPLATGLLLCGRDRGRLADAAGEAEALGQTRVKTLVLDLAKPGAGFELSRQARDFLGPRAGLVLNAGFSNFGAAATLGDDEAAAELAVNARSVLDLLHDYGADLRDQGGGMVLITASLAGLTGIPEQAGYAAGKAFLLSLGSSLAAEWRGHGITVSTHAAGLLDTDFFAHGSIPRDRRWSRIGEFMKPDIAARAALAQLEQGCMLSTSGWRNRLALLMPRLVSRRTVSRVIAWACAS